MLLQEINPFLRCAVRFRYACVSSVRCPADARILYVISGCGRLSIEGNDYPLEPGTLALIGAGFVYRLELDSPLELIALNFDYTCDRQRCRRKPRVRSGKIPLRIAWPFPHR